eukprot:CAMPEP_0194676078 /NCGR_PEP_ID=MMETSP0295-20121207/8658_1 /TAXON_ID=39354 /ORGANISM="Heterosigma akashiwo, Strain CCMP2393" /LENGTH=168 /DNA_ID=CAMNT_0039560573 /DNA_START=65 /DNA_END=568 /DNA_ORIENTATION=-
MFTGNEKPPRDGSSTKPAPGMLQNVPPKNRLKANLKIQHKLMEEAKQARGGRTDLGSINSSRHGGLASASPYNGSGYGSGFNTPIYNGSLPTSRRGSYNNLEANFINPGSGFSSPMMMPSKPSSQQRSLPYASPLVTNRTRTRSLLDQETPGPPFLSSEPPGPAAAGR